MKNKENIVTGYLLLLAAGAFWISWFLMPDPGTTDSNNILTMVKASRMNVLNSVIMQIIASVLYILALFHFMRYSPPLKRATYIGVILLAIGLLGICSDAFIHLLAYFMTDPAVNIQHDVLRVMQFMQTTGVVILLPLLLPFFIGTLLLSIGLRRQVLISNVASIMIVSAIGIGVVDGATTHALQYKVPGLTLIMLTLFALGQAVIGMELVKSALERRGVENGGEPNHKFEPISGDLTSSN